MTEITVGNGWWPIVSEAIDKASRLPEEWAFEIVGAKRAPDGSLRIDASYNAFDVSWDETVPHPWRAWQKIKLAAQARSLVTCEICGRAGRLRGDGNSARVRCEEHVDVAEDPIGLEHFLADFGDGLDMMRALHAAAKRGEDDDQG